MGGMLGYDLAMRFAILIPLYPNAIQTFSQGFFDNFSLEFTVLDMCVCFLILMSGSYNI